MSIRLESELCKLFQIRYPIFLAGMAGGPTTVNLVAAVSRAGGLGTLGAAYMEPSMIRQAIRDIRQLTHAPFAVNLFTPPVVDANRNMTNLDAVREMNRLRDQLGLPRVVEDALVTTPNVFPEQLAVLIEEKVSVISTAFGILPQGLLQQAQSIGTRIVAMVTTVREAVLAEQAGCDAIVAQGSEAGGHRGTFNVSETEQSMGANIGTLALVPQIVDHVKLPVLAAGGIMDGRGLVAALALGAQGVQMGTRFLTTTQSGAHDSHKKALLASTEEDTVITKAFSGRPARALLNPFIREWEASGANPFPFPTQNTMTRDIRNEAARQSKPDYMSLWAGQGTRLLTSGQEAEEIVAETIRQARSILS